MAFALCSQLVASSLLPIYFGTASAASVGLPHVFESAAEAYRHQKIVLFGYVCTDQTMVPVSACHQYTFSNFHSPPKIRVVPGHFFISIAMKCPKNISRL
jgi:hypothetical protein